MLRIKKRGGRLPLLYALRLPAPGLLVLVLFTYGFAASAQVSSPDRSGRDLREFYLSLDVEHHWIAGMHVDWQTGIGDRPDATAGNHTHCSAFVASACERRGIYILRPPEHGQVLLANAQFGWLASAAGRSAGWRPLDNAPLPQLYWEIQQLANTGSIIVAVILNPDEHLPGHIALVMPKEMDRTRVEGEGPMMIQASTHNFNYITLMKGFKSHLRQWPSNEIRFYIYATSPHASAGIPPASRPRTS